MNASRFLIVATLVVAIIVLGACAPAATPTSPPPTAAPPQPVATSTTAPTTAPTSAPATTAPTTAPTSAPSTSAPGAASITINLGPGRDGDQTPGIATLTARDTKTEVVLKIKPGAAGVMQPAHIHEGTCPGVGAVKYTLDPVKNGESTITVDAKLADLLTGGFSINVHESTANAGKWVACGNIPKGTVLNLDKGRDGDQTPAAAVLVSAGTKTDVFVSVKPAAAGVEQPIHIHEGSCPGVGAVKYTLDPVKNGKSTTNNVDASLDDLLKGNYSINIHESKENSGKWVACGAVKSSASGGAPAAAPTTAPAPTKGGGGGGYP